MANSCLSYMRARYYDPELGRFTSEDPIGFKGGTINLYEYVMNNPVMFIDPSGESPWGGYNYCGPGNNPGQPPIDDLDRACKDHDECYDSEELCADDVTDPPDDYRNDNKTICDLQLCLEARNFHPTTAKQRLARQLVIAIFCNIVQHF